MAIIITLSIDGLLVAYSMYWYNHRTIFYSRRLLRVRNQNRTLGTCRFLSPRQRLKPLIRLVVT